MYTDKGQRTRNHLIEVSANLFNKKGYAGTSISDILETAGYSKGALYRTFKDKDELSFEAFKYNFKIMKGYLKAAMDSSSSYIDKVLAIPRYYKNYENNKFVAGGCPILNTALESDDTSPELNKYASNAFKDWTYMIEEAIVDGQKYNEINPNVKAGELSAFIVATIEGSIAMQSSMKDRNLMKSNMDILENLIKQQL